MAPRPSLWLRFQNAIVKPDTEESASAKAAEETETVEELRAEVARANDKERAIGLAAAPVSAILGLIISSASIDYAQTHHQSVSVYDELTFVMLGMSALMLVTAMLRKRLFLGIVMALYGLAVFNLHYWGFGVPFLLGGSWYLVRSYRLSQRLKLATMDGTSPRKASSTAVPARPRPSKRYTPPT